MFSSADGPFQQRFPQSTSQTPFQRLKPICVELLSLAGRRTAATAQSQQVVVCLRRLKTTLHALLSDGSREQPTASTSRLVPADTEPVLTTSLINYVFYPLSELINGAPKGITTLPDSVTEATLDVLALLCSQWWTSWANEGAEAAGKQRQVWCDLVILSSSVLGPPTSEHGNNTGMKVQQSDEVKLAALRVLGELLCPRFKSLQSASSESKRKAKDEEWEWDGVSELPLLDEDAAPETTEDYPEHGGLLVCPTPAHLAHAATERVAKGAISFVLSSCFTIAESSQEATQVRIAAIGVARHALLLWIGGTCLLPTLTSQSTSEASTIDVVSMCYVDFSPPPPGNVDAEQTSARVKVAQRLRPLLPGITSSLTRLATSRVKAKQDGAKPRPTPSSVAASAIDLLGDLFRATLSDAALDGITASHAPLASSETRGTSISTPITVTSLEDFADIRLAEAPHSERLDESDEVKMESNSAVDDDRTESAATKDAQWALSTLAQVHLALKTVSPLTQPSLPGASLTSPVHASVQMAILRLAVILLSECASSFNWLDEQLAGMVRLDTIRVTASSGANASITTLLSWIVDLGSDVNSNSVSRSARAAFTMLQRKTHEAKADSTTLVQLGSGAILWSVLMQALDGLPAAITAQNDGSVSRLALRVSTLLGLLQLHVTTTAPSANTPVSSAKLSHDMQDTCVRLLRPLNVDRLEHIEETPEFFSSTTWRLQPIFSGLETSTSIQLSRMFFDLGRALADSLVHEIKRNKAATKVDYGRVFSLITYLIERAARSRSVRLRSDGAEASLDQDAARDEGLVSLVVASDLLRGVSSCLDNLELGLHFSDTQAKKQARKAAHRLAKRVFGLVMDVLDGDAEEAVRSRASSSPAQGVGDASTGSERDLGSVEAASDSTLVERVKGISLVSDDIDSSTPQRHGPALDLGFVRAANLTKSSSLSSQSSAQVAIQQKFRRAERNIDLSNALLFALLGSSSKLLGQSFRSLLLRGAYPLISGMSVTSTPSSDVVRQASTSAIKDIAFNTAYADVKNCLLDHADYILGSACQRLISGLDEELRAFALNPAHSSSRAIEKGGGGEMVVLPLISAQRAPFVLVEMIRVLGSEIIPMVEDAIDEILDALDRFHHHATICDGLLAVLDSILETMAMEQSTKSLPSKASPDLIDIVSNEAKRDEVDMLRAWLEARKSESAAFDDAPQHDETAKADQKEEEEDKPTKSQQVAAQILTKASMFLTHPSPVLRTRVLNLLQHGVETLAPPSRTAELLPIINSAWPFVMTRLGAAFSNAKASARTRLDPIIDLSPAAIGKSAREKDDAWYRKLEEEFVERDANVWVAAARFVEASARGVPDFVGKRVVEEAWPRFERLLTLMRWKFDARMARSAKDGLALSTASRGDSVTSTALLASEHSTSSDGPIKTLIQTSSSYSPRNHRPASTEHDHAEPSFILASATSLPAQLTLCIVTTLTTIVRHLNARMPDQAAWTITTHPTLLALLDARQPPSILRAAEQLYVELGRRNPAATAWALQAAFPAASRLDTLTPCFMNHARANVHAETVHHLLDCFAAF